MNRHLDQLQKICKSRDLALLISELQEIIPDYEPSTQILKRAFSMEHEADRKGHQSIATGTLQTTASA